MKAAKEGFRDIVDLLLQNSANLDEIENRYGMTALMLAAKWGNADICKFLIDNGANMNLKAFNHSTALVMALETRNEKTAMVLIQEGADLTIKNNQGLSALDIARLKGLKKAKIAIQISDGVKSQPEHISPSNHAFM